MIVYDSRTGTTKSTALRVGNALGLKVKDVRDFEKEEVTEPFVFFTYTMGKGETPRRSVWFLNKWGHKMMAVVANGSNRFIPVGLFATAGETIANQYQVELITKLDMGGTIEDMSKLVKRIGELHGLRVGTGQAAIKTGSQFKNGHFKLKMLVSE
ncbi:class Ib ribonucleoside-diphosphate reductase assembly flavoprotein NrdI [Bacillus sp. S17B2]|uniref:class Ib ribonucleoside-diphosphate reductase assembly flavoprotein NrdI n=1 Tax=Bacillus sp. S17B2 TaxID=2918907 RepID=UPI002282F96D|nr:class Ib ribonucleoside-diphosphate reductase assembly flavoprotein NrdI [Bacillus sp. S17B2]